MKTQLTRREIADGLKALGLERGACVEVHSSLSSLGDVEGGALTVIQALMDTVGEEGTIVMPAYRVTPPLPFSDEERRKGIVAKVRFLDEDADEKTGMGVIADTFRKLPGTCLGKGIHRVCAWGHNAKLHSQGYTYLLSVDGWVLLMGVGIDRCSCMHQAEDKIGVPDVISEYFEIPEDIRRQYPDTHWYIQYNDPRRGPPVNAWEKVRVEAERRGFIRRRRIGQAECLFFKAQPVVAIYENWLRKDPFGLFGVPKAPSD